MLLVFVIALTSISTVPNNKKSPYYYYYHNRNNNPAMPVSVFIEKERLLGLSGKSQQIIESYKRFSTMRAGIHENRIKNALEEVIRIYRMDPKSKSAAFLMALFQEIEGKRIENPEIDVTQSSWIYLNLLVNYFNRDYESAYKILSNSYLDQQQDLIFSFHLGRRLYEGGSLGLSYMAFRKALRLVENQWSNLGISKNVRKLVYRELILWLADISILTGYYNKAYGILRWLKKSSIGSATASMVKCEWVDLDAGKCSEQSYNTLPYSEYLFEKSTVSSDFHSALEVWSREKTRGPELFNSFSKRHSIWVKNNNLEKFLFWLKNNQ
ncbi:hypothetical protein KKF34_13430 [Myxococcota bacterium]|nr:hypothetical protein [Myxococcota bacterium]MBU1379296.1 hypothetical protein [Myxococcota bacterium]MBU1497871.1 hypothetical protein [Myxococcota bacterium]